MSSKLFDLTPRAGLVTGSARGLGNALPEGLAEAGATIVLNGLNTARLSSARRWGVPSDLVGTAVYLASAASDYMSRQLIFVDGGLMAVL